MSIIKNTEELNNLLDVVQKLPVKKDEQEKTVDITENGTTVVTPDEGMTLGGVTVNVEVESSGEAPANAKFQIVRYDEDGCPVEVKIGSEGDTASPEFTFASNPNYIAPLWKKVEKISFPSTVTVINKHGCCGMIGLKEITNWDNIEEIGNNGFDNCLALIYDHLPPKLTKISSNSFHWTQLLITELPDGVTSIETNAFNMVSRRMNIKRLPPNLVTVGVNAFFNNGFATVSFSEIPASVETIGSQAFKGSSIGIVGSLTFKGTPLTIAADAFAGGTKVTDIYVPWAEDAVANAPWGMINATIHYNSEV